MAEFLIYNKEHWMDVDNKYAVWHKKIEDNPIFTDEKQAGNLAKFDRKYEARYQKGDIVEVRPDGSLSVEKHFDSKMFGLLKVPGLSFEDAKKYMESVIEIKDIGTDSESKEIIRKRKYSTSNDFSITKEQQSVSVASANITAKVII